MFYSALRPLIESVNMAILWDGLANSCKLGVHGGWAVCGALGDGLVIVRVPDIVTEPHHPEAALGSSGNRAVSREVATTSWILFQLVALGVGPNHGVYSLPRGPLCMYVNVWFEVK